MPGWAPQSWGYHGDDGKKFLEGNSGESVSNHDDVYGTGDVVGCGVDFVTSSAFFTKNGEKLGKFDSPHGESSYRSG